MLWRGTRELTSYGESTVFQDPNLGTSPEQCNLTPCLYLTSGRSDRVIESLMERELAMFQHKAKSSAASAARSSIDGG